MCVLAVRNIGDGEVFLKVSHSRASGAQTRELYPSKVSHAISFTSHQLVFLAPSLKPKGFVPCILAMRGDCILGQSVCGTERALGLTLLDLASSEGFSTSRNGCCLRDVRLTGILMGSSFPRGFNIKVCVCLVAVSSETMFVVSVFAKQIFSHLEKQICE